MSTIKLLIENLLGASYKNQIKVIDTILSYFEETPNKKLQREFDDSFKEYKENLELLLSFYQEYPNFNSDLRRLTRKKALEELMSMILDIHHHDNSPTNRASYFRYSTEEFFEDGKNQEFLRYFRPQRITNEKMQSFDKEFSDLSIYERNMFAEDLAMNYDRLSFFNLPMSEDMLREYRPLILDIVGEDIIKYYDKLYPEEQIKIILLLADKIRTYINDDEYYTETIEELSKDKKAIRTLKKQLTERCSRRLK